MMKRIRLSKLNYGITQLHGFKKKIDELTVSVIGNNVWMIYNKAPFDPQLTYGVGTYATTEFFMTPSAATYGASIKLQF